MAVINSKTKTSIIALIMIFAMAASLIVLPAVNAHDPPLSWPTYAFISVAPNPIGVGQTANVNFWLALPPPTASAQITTLKSWGLLHQMLLEEHTLPIRLTQLAFTPSR